MKKPNAIRRLPAIAIKTNHRDRFLRLAKRHKVSQREMFDALVELGEESKDLLKVD